MPKRGFLIVLEGVDGSGKATQARRLLRRLRREGFRARPIEFPRYGHGIFAELVARYLKGEFGPSGAVNPYLASLLYAGDRWQARDALARWLKAGDVVVCNRYVSANKGHQCGKIVDRPGQNRFLRWVDDLEHRIFGLPRPDLTLLLDVPVGIAACLVGRKHARAYMGGKKLDMHEADLQHQRRAAATYRRLARAEKGWSAINCTAHGRLLPPEAIAEKVWRVVEKSLREDRSPPLP
jgi:dTMP kinase